MKNIGTQCFRVFLIPSSLARDDSFYVSHTGGAIGASSVLLIAPKPPNQGGPMPQGVVVAILCNMQVLILLLLLSSRLLLLHLLLQISTFRNIVGRGSQQIGGGHRQVF